MVIQQSRPYAKEWPEGDYQYCTDDDCRHKGKLQPLQGFPVHNGTPSGRMTVCHPCYRRRLSGRVLKPMPPPPLRHKPRKVKLDKPEPPIPTAPKKHGLTTKHLLTDLTHYDEHVDWSIPAEKQCPYRGLDADPYNYHICTETPTKGMFEHVTVECRNCSYTRTHNKGIFYDDSDFQKLEATKP